MFRSNQIATLIKEIEAQRQVIETYENNERDFIALERKLSALQIENDVLRVKCDKLDKKYRKLQQGDETYRKFKLYKDACQKHGIRVKE